MFAGQTWLESLNHAAYFAAVFVVDVILIVWFLLLAKEKFSGSEQNSASGG